MSQLTVERVSEDRFDESVRVSNGEIELVAPTSIGPRIVRFGFEGGHNVFRVFDHQREDWPLIGGHRLWHSPEDEDRTHQPDTDPVEATLLEDGFRLERPVNEETQIGKAITVRMTPAGTSVEVTHELTNSGLWPIEFAPWALSVLKPDGTAVMPLTPQAEADSLLPDRSITYWPYTPPGEDRLEYGTDNVYVHQDAECDGPLKIGTSAGDGWVAYVNDGQAFRKDFEYVPDATYPDSDSGAEVYTSSEILELETVGPLRTVEPGETVEHVETWTLAEGVTEPATAADVSPDIV